MIVSTEKMVLTMTYSQLTDMNSKFQQMILCSKCAPVIQNKPDVIVNHDKFWITETIVMLKRVFFDNMEYASFKRDFEIEFIRAFQANGTDAVFNFPIGERTFICKVETGSWGAKIKLEIVKLVLREKIRHHGIDREEDDGWFKPE